MNALDVLSVISYKQVHLTVAIYVQLINIGILIMDVQNAALHVKPVQEDFQRIAASVQSDFTKTLHQISVSLAVQYAIMEIQPQEFVRVVQAIVELA